MTLAAPACLQLLTCAATNPAPLFPPRNCALQALPEGGPQIPLPATRDQADTLLQSPNAPYESSPPPLIEAPSGNALLSTSTCSFSPSPVSRHRIGRPKPNQAKSCRHPANKTAFWIARCRCPFPTRVFVDFVVTSPVFCCSYIRPPYYLMCWPDPPCVTDIVVSALSLLTCLPYFLLLS
jgi:hypothetical protein